MSKPYYLRTGTGDFNYVNHRLNDDSYVCAGPGYERKGINTCIHTRREWKMYFPDLVRSGKLERVTGKAAVAWRKSQRLENQ